MIIKITSFGDSQVDVLFELYSIVCLSLTQCDRDRESVSSFAAIKSWGQIGRRDRQQETRTSGVLEASAKATGRESGRWPSYQRQEARGPLFTTSQFQTERFLLTKIRQILILIIDPGFQCQLPWLCTSTSDLVGGLTEQIGFMEALGLRFVRVMDQTYNYAFPMSINVIS